TYYYFKDSINQYFLTDIPDNQIDRTDKTPDVEKSVNENSEISVEEMRTAEGDDPSNQISTTTTDTPDQDQEKKANEKNQALNIKVFNGSGTPGVASLVADILNQKGYINIGVGNAQNYNYQNSIIILKQDNELELEDIKDIFSIDPEMQINNDQKEDIVIIIGRDYRD
ncbi:LytR C-terminal domain-containing protein, partial [Patescibacteria group bacterium]